MAIDLALAVERLRPGAAYLQSEDGQSIAEWRDGRVRPTPAELQTASDAALAELAAANQADAADRTALRNAVATLLAGTATAAQTQQALGRLIRSLVQRGVIG